MMASLISPAVGHCLDLSIDYVINELMRGKRQLLAPYAFTNDQSICKLWLRGNCLKGSQCTHRHIITHKTTVCKHWLRGLCKKQDSCEFLHEFDASKMPQCHFFINFGQCSNPDCQFLHVSKAEKVHECHSYTHKGFCIKGPNCNNRHIKKIMCPDYLTGFCIKGSACELSHPKFHLVDPSADADAEERQLNQGDNSAAFDQFNYDTERAVTRDRRPQRSRNDIVCNRCGQTGHIAAECPNETNKVQFRDLATVLCFKCNQRGHYANNCPNPKASQSGRNPR